MKTLNTMTRIVFGNFNDKNQANRILLDAGFKYPTNTNSGLGYFTLNDIWLNIQFKIELTEAIKQLLDNANIKYVEISYTTEAYKVHNHGGYLD